MKKLTIEVTIDEITNKMLTGIKTVGFSEESAEDQLQLLGILERIKVKDISHHFQLVGILENAKGIIQTRLDKLFDRKI